MAKAPGESLIRDILDGIFRGALRAGDRLPAFDRMAKRHRMSVVSVREAIHKLRLMGLVRVQQGGGTFLVENIPSIPDILDTRKYLEAVACLLAAERADHADYRTLDRIIEAMEDDYARRDTVAYTQRDLEFHLTIGRMSKNAILSAFLENIQELLYYLQERTHMMRGTLQRAYRFHPAIAEALKRRDGSAAQTLIVNHIESVKRAWNALDKRKTVLEKAATKGGGSKPTKHRNGGGSDRAARPAGTLRSH
jgi:GntR family transcriptional regulator, transcriptional repressor for pyruvate dehydrogenase complex